jgi:hypothetical protein
MHDDDKTKSEPAVGQNMSTEQLHWRNSKQTTHIRSKSSLSSIKKKSLTCRHRAEPLPEIYGLQKFIFPETIPANINFLVKMKIWLIHKNIWLTLCVAHSLLSSSSNTKRQVHDISEHSPDSFDSKASQVSTRVSNRLTLLVGQKANRPVKSLKC